MTTCDRCGQIFSYDPRYHRCPGEWEAMVEPLANPYEGMTWVEEQMAKQKEER